MPLRTCSTAWGIKRSNKSTVMCSLLIVIRGNPAKISVASIISVISKPPGTGVLKKYRPHTSTKVRTIIANNSVAASPPRNRATQWMTRPFSCCCPVLKV